MHYTWEIANRYLRSKRRTGFISLITYLSAAGVAVGAAALVIVLSIMNGFEEEVRARIIGADAPLRVETFSGRPIRDWRAVADTIRAFDRVEAVTPYILEKGMIRHRHYTEGAVIRGIDPETVGDVNNLPEMLVTGSLAGLDPPPGSDEPAGIILGRYLADVLATAPGDTVFLLSAAGMTGPFSQPRMGRFRVTGVFESGLAEFDQVFALIGLHRAQSLFQFGGDVSGLDVRTTTLEDANTVKQRIDERLGYPLRPRTWFEMRKTLFSWMQLEKWAMFIVLSLIILVAAFNIVSTLVMVTLEKRKEVGILMAMGATRREISRIFLYQGFAVGVSGTIVGLLLGYGLLSAQLKWKFFSLPSDIYMLNTLPVRMQPLDFAAVGVVGVLLCLLAAVYPARRAAALDPVEAIRYE
ncbi:MAG: Lipoprotein-releasing system transmembrane protein LolE [Calditrichaeota bacterium]|nr:Lipoprotein-releasing system transmembrane protein LolE [Calditrichota bacterium]